MGKHLIYLLLFCGIVSCEQKKKTERTENTSLTSLYQKDTLSLEEFNILSNHLINEINLDSVSISSDTNLRRFIKICNTHRFELCPHEVSILSQYPRIKEIDSDSLLIYSLLNRYKHARYNSWRGVLTIDELNISLGYFLSERYHIIPTDTCKRFAPYSGRSSGQEF